MHRYQNNAFRVLGLMPSATYSEVMRRANEVKVKKSLGVEIAYEYDFSWMGAIDRSEENVIHAMQRLEDPILRFKEELAWFWIYSASDKEALALLAKNQRQEAHYVWNEVINHSSAYDAEKCSAYYNQAILTHSSVIGKESLINYSEKNNETGRIALSDSHWKNWKFAWNRFLYVVHQGYFLDSIRGKIKRINDPRLSEDKAKEIITQFLSSIIEPNLVYIGQALAAKDHKRVQKQSSILNGLNLNLEPLFGQQQVGSDMLKDGFNKVLSYHIHSLNTSVDALNNDLAAIKDNESKKVFIKLYTDFSSKADVLLYEANLVDINNTSDFMFSRDNASKALRNISIEIHNRFKDYAKSYEIIQKALTYAGSTYQRQKCENDACIVKKNLDTNRVDNSRASTVTTKSTTSKNVFKQIPWWVWVGGIWLLVTILSNTNTTTTKQPASSSTSSNYSPGYQYTIEDSMSLSDLKTKIEDLRTTIAWQEKRIAELREATKQKGNELSSLKTEIESIENKYENSSNVPGDVEYNYDRNIQKYNSLVPTYNSYINQEKNMYSDYEKNINEENRLVAAYNRRAR